MIFVGFAVLIAMALCGAPLFVIILGAAALGFLASGLDLVNLSIELHRIADTPLLVALPLFTFAGYVLAESKTSQRLMDLVNSLFGWMPGGLAIVGFVACAFFTRTNRSLRGNHCCIGCTTSAYARTLRLHRTI